MRIRTLRRSLLRGAGLCCLCLLLLVFAVWLHTRLFPLSLESTVRRLVYRHFMLSPAVVDGWGALMTRVLPLDDDHLVVGLSTSLATLRRQGDGFRLCSKQVGIGIVHDLAVRGSMVYVAAGGENLAWYDCSNPCAPKRLGRYLFNGYGFGLRILGDRLYLANRAGGLVVFRLDHRGAPRFESVRYGSIAPLEPEDSGWMTNDVEPAGDRLLTADGNKGLVSMPREGESGAGLAALFPPELEPAGKLRNIDPAPLRLRVHGNHLYAAMRDRGVAVFRIEDGAGLRFVAAHRPDEGEVLDLALENGVLYVPTTLGNIFAFDLGQEPEDLSTATTKYSTGEEKYLHSVACRPPYLYASAVGAGLFQFRLGQPEPLAGWRAPEEFRSLARVGPWFAAALGSGGVAVFQDRDGVWQKTSSWSLPSLAFGVLGLGELRFAACADVSGTHVFAIDPRGQLSRLLRIPTPEHVFSAAFLPPGQLATADGVYGLLRYRFEAGSSDPGFRPLVEGADLSGYSMHVDAWQGHFIAGNISGPCRVAAPAPGDPGPASAAREPGTTAATPGALPEPLPSFCYTGASSPDGDVYALACRGEDIHLFSSEEGRPAVRRFEHTEDVVSLLPVPPHLFVGGFPDSLTVYRIEGDSWRREAEFSLNGTPYAMLADGKRVLVAAGSDGVHQLSETDAGWRLEKIAVR